MKVEFILITLLIFILLSCSNNPYYNELDSDSLLCLGEGYTDPKGFDPIQSNDVTSATFVGEIYECLYQYSYFDRPYKIIPCLAEDLPVITKNKLTYTIKLKEKIYFQDDKCFTKTDGKGREVEASDFIYSIKRLADSNNDPQGYWLIEGRIKGIEEYFELSKTPLIIYEEFKKSYISKNKDFINKNLRLLITKLNDIKHYFQQKSDNSIITNTNYNSILSNIDNTIKRLNLFNFKVNNNIEILSFINSDLFNTIKSIYNYCSDYEMKNNLVYFKEIEGLKIRDKYTLEINLVKPYPQLLWALAMNYTAIVPREAVEYYKEEFINHPVGTGPYKLKYWIHWHKIVYEKNPTYRKEYFPKVTYTYADKEMLNDAGKLLPLSDNVVFTIMKQDQPAWLYFLSGYFDLNVKLPKDNVKTALITFDKLSPDMAKKNIILKRNEGVYLKYDGFNMEDKILGSNKKLRQAISLAYNRDLRIKVYYGSQGFKAEGPIPPGFFGYDVKYKNPYSDYNITKAKELLKEAGFPHGIDKNGNQLVLNYDFKITDPTNKQLAELFKKEMKELGIDIKLIGNTWNNLLQKLIDKNVQIFQIGWQADYPDAENFLQLFYGPNSGNTNNSNYNNPQYNSLYEELSVLNEIYPEEAMKKQKLTREMENIITEDCPVIFNMFYVETSLIHSWRKNFIRHPFAYNTLKYQKVDGKLRKKMVELWNKPDYLPIILVSAIILAILFLFFYRIIIESKK